MFLLPPQKSYFLTGPLSSIPTFSIIRGFQSDCSPSTATSLAIGNATQGPWWCSCPWHLLSSFHRFWESSFLAGPLWRTPQVASILKINACYSQEGEENGSDFPGLFRVGVDWKRKTPICFSTRTPLWKLDSRYSSASSSALQAPCHWIFTEASFRPSFLQIRQWGQERWDRDRSVPI